MAMRTVAKEEIDRWCLSNERGLWREAHSISNTVTPQVSRASQGSMAPQVSSAFQESMAPQVSSASQESMAPQVSSASQGSMMPQGVMPQERVTPWQRQPAGLTKDKASQRRPWYQRQPRTWFKPVFNVLLFIRERREAFIFIAIFAVIFGLAWWLTSWLFV